MRRVSDRSSWDTAVTPLDTAALTQRIKFHAMLFQHILPKTLAPGDAHVDWLERTWRRQHPDGMELPTELNSTGLPTKMAE